MLHSANAQSLCDSCLDIVSTSLCCPCPSGVVFVLLPSFSLPSALGHPNDQPGLSRGREMGLQGTQEGTYHYFSTAL